MLVLLKFRAHYSGEGSLVVASQKFYRWRSVLLHLLLLVSSSCACQPKCRLLLPLSGACSPLSHSSVDRPFGPFGPSRATAATLSLLGRRRLLRLAAVVAPCTLHFVLLQGGQSGHGGRRVPQPSSQARPAAKTRRALSVVGRPCWRAGGVWRPAWWRAGGRTSGVPRAAAVPLLQPNCPPLDYYSHGADDAGLLLWGLRLGTYQSIAYIHTHDTANTNHQQPTTNHVQAPPRPPGRPGRRRRVLRPSRAQGGPYEGSETLDVSWARPAIDSLPKSPPTVQSLAT